MEIQGLAFLPIFLSIWMLLGLCSTTTITVILGHSKYPYIRDHITGCTWEVIDIWQGSNTGEELPESVVFTVVFMVISIVGAGIASVKYRFMIIHSEPSEKRQIIGQRILYAMGWLMKTNPLVHRISAGVAFFSFAIYNLCQSICLYKRSLSSRCMCHIRLASTLVTIVALLIFAVGLGSFFLLCTTDSCKEIFSITGLAGDWTGFFGLTVYPVMNYTDFQCLSLELSQKGISIVLRKKTQDPENPQ